MFTQDESLVVADLLDVRGLRTHFRTRGGVVRAVDGVNIRIGASEIVGLVGESGSGKSLTAYSIIGLVPQPGEVVAGEIRFQGEDLRRKSSEGLRRVRGTGIGMVFQEPLTALNPLFRVGAQLDDVMKEHLDLSGEQRRRQVVELLAHVGIPSPERVAHSYPFELSGGMRQRVVIAMAIARRPALVIADEPTTALDTTVQAQIMDLLLRLVREDGISVLLITHDLGIVAQMSKRVYVMYAGKIVEEGPTADVFLAPRHPYTSALLGCLPSLQQRADYLSAIEGSVPAVLDDGEYCRFAARCAFAKPTCRSTEPLLRPASSSHAVACHYADELTLATPLR